MRSATIDGDTLSVRGDWNSSTTLEIMGVPSSVKKLQINGEDASFTTNNLGWWEARIAYPQLRLAVPDLSGLNWTYVDSLPELSPTYDDSAWPNADHTTTNNTDFPLKTPVSLYGSDYGFHTGVLLFRGHFTADGTEASLRLSTMGGKAFGYSLWLNSTFLGSWGGIDKDAANNATYTLPVLTAGARYVITLVLDNMGLDENWIVGPDEMKRPRGILAYALLSTTGQPAPATVAWKLTGNLGGEDYADAARGPLNEGGFFAERQGFHLLRPPTAAAPFQTGSTPFDGLPVVGARLYTAPLDLRYPAGRFDIPLAFAFTNATAATGGRGRYRAFLYVNGFQFGRYISSIGPQTNFPVPEGILNYDGPNTLALLLWALDPGGAKVPDFYLAVGQPILTGREKVELVDAPAWTARAGAY